MLITVQALCKQFIVGNWKWCATLSGKSEPLPPLPLLSPTTATQLNKATVKGTGEFYWVPLQKAATTENSEQTLLNDTCIHTPSKVHNTRFGTDAQLLYNAAQKLKRISSDCPLLPTVARLKLPQRKQQRRRVPININTKASHSMAGKTSQYRSPASSESGRTDRDAVGCSREENKKYNRQRNSLRKWKTGRTGSTCHVKLWKMQVIHVKPSKNKIHQHHTSRPTPLITTKALGFA